MSFYAHQLDAIIIYIIGYAYTNIIHYHVHENVNHKA